MKRLNVTLTVEKDLLPEARTVAARRQVAFERIQHLLEQPKVHLGGARTPRGDLHERFRARPS